MRIFYMLEVWMQCTATYGPKDIQDAYFRSKEKVS